jgi:hypothetical protein
MDSAKSLRGGGCSRVGDASLREGAARALLWSIVRVRLQLVRAVEPKHAVRPGKRQTEGRCDDGRN